MTTLQSLYFRVLTGFRLVYNLVEAELTILTVYKLFVIICVFFDWIDNILCVNCVDAKLVGGLSLCCTVTPLQLTLDFSNKIYKEAANLCSSSESIPQRVLRIIINW